MNIKETIRAEIERRIDTCYRTDGRIAPPRTRNAIVVDEFQDLLAFIDTLPERPVECLANSSKTLEQPAKRAVRNVGQLEIHPYNGDEGEGYAFRLNGCRIIIIKEDKV